MNRKCAAGTGAFLEEIALRLDLPVRELERPGRAIDQGVTLGSFCTVFAATEILEKIRAGERVEDIVKGAFRSVVKRIMEMDTVDGDAGDDRRRGGPQPVLVKLVEESFGRRCCVPPDPQFIGAFGAALFAAGMARSKEKDACWSKSAGRNRRQPVDARAPRQYPCTCIAAAQQATIFEGGIGAIGPVLREQLQQLGIGRDSVRQLVVTHAHPDHVMAVPLFRADVPGRSWSAPLRSRPRPWPWRRRSRFFCKIDDPLTELLVEAGLIDRAAPATAGRDDRSPWTGRAAKATRSPSTGVAFDRAGNAGPQRLQPELPRTGRRGS